MVEDSSRMAKDGLKDHCCGGFAGTPPGPFSALGTDTRRHHRRPEFRTIDYKLQSAQPYNHKYKCSFINAHN